MSAKRYKATIAYDGTDYFGWQIQPEAVTVTSCLQNTFTKVFNQPITIVGASRTDTGVHALGQVATFTTDLNLSNETIRAAWNNRLPKSILIRDLQEAPPEFNPHKNVKQKTYYYHLFYKKHNPFFARFGLHYEFMHHVDLEKFATALALYEGEHDFASFCKVEDKEKSTIRTIDSITLTKIPHYGMLRIAIKGKSFLRFQIRRMVGYALDLARRKHLPVSYLQEIRDNPNCHQLLLKVDGCGLCLRKVMYHDE